MDVYILNDQLYRETIIDTYESLIWTERFAAAGDFELVIDDSLQNRSLLGIGTWLAIDKSRSVMMVENHEADIDDEGARTLKVTGPSIEYILAGRVAKNSMANLTDEPKWPLTGTPMGIANKVFNDICVLGNLSEDDKIPYYVPGSLYPPDTDHEVEDEVTLETTLTTVYAFLQEIGNIYHFGFRLYRGPDTSKIYFNVYKGNNRTSSQSTYPPVIFSPSLESLSGIKTVKTSANYKNVAYVFSKFGSLYVHNEEDPAQVTGFNRRVLLVDASDIETSAGLTLNQLLEARGRAELAKHRQFEGFDGEVPEYAAYKFNEDYHLGDIVEFRDDQGSANHMRIVEHIFVSDQEGERSYPTVAIDTVITPGTWATWESNKYWADYPLATAGPGGIPPADPEAVWVWKKFEDS